MTSKPSAAKPPSDAGRKTAAAICIAVAFLVALLSAWLTGCGHTVIPEPVEAMSASFDGNAQTSGVIASTPAGFVVTAHFRERYNALVEVYGRDFSPPLKADAGLARQPDGQWLITRQRMVDFLEMNAWKRAGIVPTNP